MSELLINKQTKAKISRYLKRPSQGLLLVGPEGSGKLAVASKIAAELLGIQPEKLDDYAYFSIISLPEGKKEIPIESIRDMIKDSALQVPGNQPVKRVVIIKDAHLLNPQSQNAFLKSLEEPNPGTVFILSANSKAGLLATITSRATLIDIGTVALEEAINHYKSVPRNEVAAAWALSQGAAGLLDSLIYNQNSQLKDAVNKAKGFLTKSRYEKLIELDSLKDKAELTHFLDGLSRVIGALYKASARRQDAVNLKKFTKAARQVLSAQNSLESNVAPRLVILKLILELPV